MWFPSIITTYFLIQSINCFLTKIIDGFIAKNGQFPHLVSIQQQGGHMCGGAILNENWILTAAHCVYRKPIEDLKIVAGITNLKETGQIRNVKLVVVDEDIDDIVWVPDVALVKLEMPLIFNEKVKAIELNKEEVPDWEKLTVAGWGETENDYPLDLRYLTIDKIPLNDCKAAHYPLPVFDFNICSSTYTFQGVCFGDSGSPVLYKNKVAGIVNWVAPCAIGAPDVHSKVSAFAEWIEKQMANN